MTPAEAPASTSGPTDRAGWDRSLARVHARRKAWTEVTIERRIGYLTSAMERILATAPAWVDDACRARGIDPASPAAGEEWIAGPSVTLRQMRLFVDALRHGGRPPLPGRVDERPDGHRVPVFPIGVADRILYRGMRAEIRLRAGMPASQGALYRGKGAGERNPGRVALVLGAGNISSIAPLDVIHKLFVEDEVVVLKMNPVNAYLGPHLEDGFRDLIDDGFLAVTYGGIEAGEFLCTDDRVGSIHLTGSDRTYDAIVWGTDEDDVARRKRESRPRIDKPFSAELGCVTPVVVVPGAWSESDLRFQAEHVAGMVAHNASFNCTAAKVLVTPRDWSLRGRFLGAVRDALAHTPARRAYYPGAQRRYDEFLERYPTAERLGPEGDGVVPWTLVPEVPARSGEYALTREAFCGVLADVPIEGSDPASFLDRAVELCNEVLWGTLSCVVLIDRATAGRHREALERAVRGLRYGGVAINTWTGMLFGIGNTPWGAFPGHTREDIGSGVGTVHNALFLDHPEKAVLYAPFRQWPKPVYFAGHRTLHRLGRHLTTFAGRRTPGSFVATLLAGVRG